MEDQRICIKFCVKNGFKGAEIFWMLQTAYGDAVMSRRRVFEWYKRSKEGREETADNEQRPERNGESQSRSDKDDPELLKRVITGDETWIYGFDSETTQQASEWRFKKEPRPKKARKAPSKVKVMLTVFFDYQGIVHHEFQQQGSTITADSYLGVLRRLREAIRQKQPELWRSKSWILHHDNAPAHTALKISKFLQDHSTSVFPQPPYSPDLAPCDFFLFGKLKKSGRVSGRVSCCLIPTLLNLTPPVVELPSEVTPGGKASPVATVCRSASYSAATVAMYGEVPYLPRSGVGKLRLVSHMLLFGSMAAALQKIDLDPEQQLYTPKIVDIAAAVMEMHGDI
ncbi:CLCN3 [Cordylochernes scorpioides]|uniref:CLCN3 n=1 Tax=Cordylochernes scorpioides TaxID=51811 RepID=A0ABY6L137_9ARAC|nr:CLCN3 [Cordylochernes scorpioides]